MQLEDQYLFDVHFGGITKSGRLLIWINWTTNHHILTPLIGTLVKVLLRAVRGAYYYLLGFINAIFFGKCYKQIREESRWLRIVREAYYYLLIIR